jgi:putative oxidoreductase
MISQLYGQFSGILNKIHIDIALLFARLSIAPVFWLSGRTKVDGFAIREEAIVLFEYEYQLPFISPVLAAHLAALGEHLLPILLVLGLFTRFGAAGLIMMTMVIQIFVYPDAWGIHFLWFSILFFILIRGPGAISLDHLVFKDNK